MTSFTRCPTCHQTYPSDENHECTGMDEKNFIIRTASRTWTKCSMCDMEYPADTSHVCPTTVTK